MAQAEEVELLSDGRAKAVAGYWFDERGPATPLSLLAGDGRITGGLTAALHRDLRVLETAAEGAPSVAQEQLRQLLVYARDNGPRGPQPGWQELDAVHVPPTQGPQRREPPRRAEFSPRHEVARRQETPTPLQRHILEPSRRSDLTVDLSSLRQTPRLPPELGGSALDLDL